MRQPNQLTGLSLDQSSQPDFPPEFDKNPESTLMKPMMNSVAKKIKRYNLALPEDLFDELQRTADERQTTVVDLLRRFIKLGLIVLQIENSPDSALLIREGESERQIILI